MLADASGETSAECWLHVVALKSRSSFANFRYINLAASCCFMCSFIIIIKKQEILAKILLKMVHGINIPSCQISITCMVKSTRIRIGH